MAVKCFKPMYGFCSHLEERLDKSDDVLNLPAREYMKLCKDLNNQFYTYLVLSDSLCHEIVCVELCEGRLSITRAHDGTDLQYWPCGASVKYDTVPSAIYDMTKNPFELDESPCEPELYEGSICNGNCTVHFKEGLAIKETVNKRQIQDGCYDNPVPTYKDGKLVALAEGSNRVMVDNGCCG